MSALDTFLPEVRPWAPGVPDVVAYKAIRNAAVEFCQRTRLWKWESTVAVLATDDATRAITIPTGSEIIDFEAVLWDGLKLTPKSTEELDGILPGWRTGLIGPGVPQHITQVNEDTLRLVPAPMQDGSLYLCLRLQPAQNATTLPDFMDKHREALGWGALARLLMTPGQSYTNPELAMAYGARFEARLNTKSQAGSRGQQNARIRTKSSLY